MIYNFTARVVAKQYGGHELLNLNLPRYHKRGYRDQWLFTSDELATPLGLPLRFTVKIGIKDQIRVDSAETVMLKYYMPAPQRAGFEMWLPTEEVLDVWIEQQQR